MSKENRINIINEIEKKRFSKIITYITGDRSPFNTQIADDSILIIKKHLDLIGKQEKIGIFLYTRGGEMMTPLRLVRLIREYCNFFEILIPYRALSAGTLMSLGANTIVLGKLAELSPVDPTADHPFNPVDPNDPNKQKKIPISVEDVTSYFLLAKERANVKDEQMVNIFNELTNKIHPLALGNIYRGYRMIRMLAKKLLTLHMDEDKNKQKIENIIKNLTEELCIHGYLISRDEAEKVLKLNIEKPDDEIDNLMWNLYKEYEIDMELTEHFDPLSFLGTEKSKSLSYYGAFIESAHRTDGFLFKGRVDAISGPMGQMQTGIKITPQPKWIEIC